MKEETKQAMRILDKLVKEANREADEKEAKRQASVKELQKVLSARAEALESRKKREN